MPIRIADIIISFLGILILLPFLLIIALLIKIESYGPVLFKQDRIGKNGHIFVLLKFRTMFVESEKHGLLTVGSHDPRITKTGLWLRKFKIDELPQLLNVLLGDMSMVGPRPEVKKYVDLYTEEQMKVLSVKPGITDYASITFIDENKILGMATDFEKTYIEEIMPKKIELNMKFINNPSLSNYFQILIKTFLNIIG